MSVATEAGREVPMARFPVSEMATQVMSIPMAVAGEVVVVMMIVMRVVVAEMVETVAEESVAEAVTTSAAFGRGVDLREDHCKQAGTKHGDGFSQKHRCLTSTRAPLSPDRSANSTASPMKRSG